MNIETRTKYLKNRDDFISLEEYVKDLCEHNMIDDAAKVIIDAQQKFAIPISIISFFLSKKQNDEIFSKAFSDYPYSPVLHMIHIKSAQTEEEKIKRIKDSLTKIGSFDTNIWDFYRSLDSNQERANEIWKEQISCQLINIENSKTLCEMENENIDLPELTEQQKEIESLLSVYSFDFSKIQTCFALLDYEENELFYEMCINFHPYNSTLWLKYLLFNPNSEELSKRSVRFCFKSGRIWSMRLDHTHDIDMSNFEFFDKSIDANLVLGKLCTIDKDNTEQYCDAFLKLNIFKTTESFVFLFLLLDNYYIKTNNIEKRRNVLQILTNKYPNRSDLWIRRIEFTKELFDNENPQKNVDEVRNLYKEALSHVNVDRIYLLDSWMSFETQVSEDYAEVINFITEDEKKKEIVSQDENKSQFTEKTIYVNNFDESMSQNTLFDIFKEFGRIVRVTMKHKFAFVEFANAESAKMAVNTVNGRVINGQKISVQPHVQKEKHTLFVKYDPTAKPESLISFLKTKTQIEKFTYRFSKNSKADFEKYHTEMKGLCFIDVESANDAAKLLALGNNELFHGKTLVIQMAKQNKKEAHQFKVKKDMKKANDEQMKQFFGLV